jgi:hypothetical protein
LRKTWLALSVAVGVENNHLVIHEDHFDVNVGSIGEGNIGLEIFVEQAARAGSEFAEYAFTGLDMPDDGASKLGFVNLPQENVSQGRMAERSFIDVAGVLHMLDLAVLRERRQILFKYVLTLLHIIEYYASVL